MHLSRDLLLLDKLIFVKIIRETITLVLKKFNKKLGTPLFSAPGLGAGVAALVRSLNSTQEVIFTSGGTNHVRPYNALDETVSVLFQS